MHNFKAQNLLMHTAGHNCDNCNPENELSFSYAHWPSPITTVALLAVSIFHVCSGLLSLETLFNKLDADAQDSHVWLNSPQTRINNAKNTAKYIANLLHT